MAEEPVIEPSWWLEIREVRTAEPDVEALEGGPVARQREGNAVGSPLEANEKVAWPLVVSASSAPERFTSCGTFQLAGVKVNVQVMEKQ